MKYYLVILFSLALTLLKAQRIKGQEIDTIILIDSLIRNTGGFPLQYEWIKREKDNLIFSHHVIVYDRTRQIQNKSKTVTDTINLNNLKDLTLLTPFLDKYEFKDEFEINQFLHLLKLIDRNNITSIEFAGPGDCYSCSRYIFINNRTAFLILDKDSHCYIKDCYWPPRKARKRRIKKDVYLISNIN